MNTKIREFGVKVGRYFLEFLETDFKRQQTPRRRIQLKNDAGQLIAFPLRKYDRLYHAVSELLSDSNKGSYSLKIQRRRYTAQISPTLRNLIAQLIDSLDTRLFDAVAARVVEEAKKLIGEAVNHPEQYVDRIIQALEAEAAKQVVLPLLGMLDGPLKEKAYSAIESVFEIETDLIEAFTREAAQQLPEAFNSLIVTGDDSAVRAVLSEFLDPIQSRQRFKDFFEIFATFDAYQELRDRQSLMRTGENLQVYLYVADLKHRNCTYPLFYIPISVAVEESSGDFLLEFDPHLYINKPAIDYVAQEAGVTKTRLAINPIEDHIIASAGVLALLVR